MLTHDIAPVSPPENPIKQVILADPPSRGIGKLQQCPNLGILSISSYVKRAIPGMVVHYVPERYSARHHAALIRRHRVKLYAISFTSYSALRAYRTISYLKARFPRLIVVCGGPHPSAAPEEVALQPGVDVCVMGEGEVTFTELVRAAAGDFSAALSSIRGIAYRRGAKCVVNPPRQFVGDIDEFPMADRSVVSDRDFAGLPLSKAHRTAEMVVTRGCPYRCIFCSNPVFRPEELRRRHDDSPGTRMELSAVGRSLRMRSPESIAREASHLYELGYREIYLHSDELNCSEPWAIAVCEALAALKLEDLCFQTNIRADKVSPDFARALQRMNTWLVRLGIESSSPRVMHAQKKKVSLPEVERACAVLSAAGLKVFGYFMMFQIWEENGRLEFETEEEVEKTIEFAEKLSGLGHLHYIGWAVATPIQGSAMYEVVRRHGLIDEGFYPSQRWHICHHVKTLSPRRFNQLLTRGLRLQASLALRNGGVGWGNWRRIASKGFRLLLGHNAPRISDFSG